MKSGPGPYEPGPNISFRDSNFRSSSYLSLIPYFLTA